MSCAQCRRLLNPEFGGFTTSQPLEDILSSLKDQEERTISREALLTQLLSVTNASVRSKSLRGGRIVRQRLMRVVLSIR